MRYLTDCLGHEDLATLEISDAGRFRDYLFDRGMSSSSVKRVFSSVRAVINLAIREQGLAVTNVFSGTFIPDDEAKTQRLPIPNAQACNPVHMPMPAIFTGLLTLLFMNI